MCVIMIVDKDKVRPTPHMIERAWDRNKDGGGAAWREPAEGKKEGREVVWRKGITEMEEMQELNLSLPVPFVLHFRVASCGGVRQSLTHPFPIEKTAPLALQGRTTGQVLFHNGDWKGWADASREAALRSNTRIPMGRWSDTRGIAWLCSIYGPGFMEFLPEQKGVVFGPKEMDIFTGNGWTKVNDVWCSNDFFMPKNGVMARGPMCRLGSCTRTDYLDEKGYCPLHKDGRVNGSVGHANIPQTGNTVLTPSQAQGIKDLPPVGGNGNVTPTGSGGGPVVTPFRPAGSGYIVPLDVAKNLYEQKDQIGNRLLSKNLWKRIQKLYGQMGDAKHKKKDTAKLELVKISSSLTRLQHSGGRPN